MGKGQTKWEKLRVFLSTLSCLREPASSSLNFTSRSWAWNLQIKTTLNLTLKNQAFTEAAFKLFETLNTFTEKKQQKTMKVKKFAPQCKAPVEFILPRNTGRINFRARKKPCDGAQTLHNNKQWTPANRKQSANLLWTHHISSCGQQTYFKALWKLVVTLFIRLWSLKYTENKEWEMGNRN